MSENQQEESLQTEKQDENRSINLKVINQNGNEMMFKIKKLTPLDKLMTSYCTHNGLSTNSVRFLYDGQRISPEKTAKDFEMEDDDIIDVVLHQTGGF